MVKNGALRCVRGTRRIPNAFREIEIPTQCGRIPFMLIS
jgi:hypothetical protein